MKIKFISQPLALTGFDPSSTSVQLGVIDCSVKTVTYNEIVCVTSQSANDGQVAVVVNTFGADIATDVTYTYSSDGAAAITNISPTVLDVVGGKLD